MTKLIQVPTINAGPGNYDWLFQTANELSGDNLDVTFDFSNCWFLQQNAVAFLGGLARLIQYRHGNVRFAWETMHDDVCKNLGKNDFTKAFGYGENPWVGNTIPYREDAQLDKIGMMEYLKSYWLGRGWVHVSDPLRDAILGNVWEIYANAFDHSGSRIGVFSCGQHFPRLGLLKLAVADFGVGIPGNVRSYFLRQGVPEDKVLSLSSDKALEWAFRRGTTTTVGGPGRGLGLDLLKSFVRVNHGRLEIYSHNGYAFVSDAHETYTNRVAFFQGTMVNITFRCDEKYYQLASEQPNESLF